MAFNPSYEDATALHHLRALHKKPFTTSIPVNHLRYLGDLKRSGFYPRVIYDVGACVLHWTQAARVLWPQATIIAFDAFEKLRPIYEEAGVQHFIGVLSSADGRRVNWYENWMHPAGNSYYREVGCTMGDFFLPGSGIERTARALDSVVQEMDLPLPDLIKLDVQGSEMDILQGGQNTLAHARHLIVEMQHERYNEGAPLAHETLPWIMGLGWRHRGLFCNNGPDGDHGFERRDEHLTTRPLSDTRS